MAPFQLASLRRALGLGESRPDHPMTSIERASALLAELPADDPISSVADVMSWLEGISASDSFTPELRASIVICLDDAARPHWRRALGLFLAPHGTPVENFDGDTGVLRKLAVYADTLSAAYVRCFSPPPRRLIPATAAETLTRWMAVLGRRAAVRRMLYLAPLAGEWREISALYQRAVELQAERLPVRLESIPPRMTSVRQEYVTLLLFEMMMPGGLKIRHMVLAYRIANRFARGVQLMSEAVAGARCFIDPADDHPPRKVARATPGPGALYVDTTNALAQLHSAMENASDGDPGAPDREYGGEFTCRERDLMLRHALNWWGVNPHAPRRQRVALQAPARVGIGLQAVFKLCPPLYQGGFSGSGEQGMQILFGKDDAGVTEAETVRSLDAVSTDLSASGIGIAIASLDARKLRVGNLLVVSIAPESRWKLAVIRRIAPRDNKTVLGLEIISVQPQVAWVSASNSLNTNVWDEAHIREKSFGEHFFQCILLGEIPPPDNEESTLIAPFGRCALDALIQLPLAGGVARLRVKSLVDSAEEYTLIHAQLEELHLHAGMQDEVAAGCKTGG
jgi:hypothetical protein